MIAQPGFFDAEDRLRALSAAGDPLERLKALVDFELFRADLEAGLQRAERSKGGRPPYDAVLMFRILVLQTLYTLSDDQTEYQIRDRLSFMRFVGLALHDAVPDAKTVWLYREQLTKAGALQRAFERFDAMLRERGYLAMGGQIVDATVIEARRPRLNAQEKATIRGGGTPSGWSKARHGRSIGKAAGPSSAAASRRHRLARCSVRPSVRSRCRCLATRTTSASTARMASSAASSSPTPRGMTAASLPRCSIPRTRRAACGPTPPTAARPICDCSIGNGWWHSSSVPSRAAGRCRRTSPAAMRRGRRCALAS